MAKTFEIRLFGKPIFEKRSGVIGQAIKDHWLSEIMGSSSASGRLVNEENSLQISAVWACIQLLGNTTGMLPVNVYQKKDGKRLVLQNDPRQFLIHSRPNMLMNSFTWRRTSMMQCASSGNSYSVIRRNPFTGVPESLDMVPQPKRVEAFEYNGKIWYDLQGQLGLKLPVPQDDMLHFKWGSLNGIIGKNPIQVARETIGQSLAMQDYASKVFSKGGAKRVAMKTTRPLTNDQKTQFRNTWDAEYAGVENLQKLMFLEGGAELVEVGMTPEDAQFIHIMKFKIEEIARIYSIPLHLIQSLDQATNNNIEWQGMSFVIYTMMPHLVNWEEEIRMKLFPDEPEKYVKFNVNGLMRGDVKTRAMFYRTMQDLGNMNINEVRELEELDPIEEGNVHYVQVNRMPIDAMNKVTAPGTSPEPDDQPEDMVRKLIDEAFEKYKSNGHKKETVIH